MKILFNSIITTISVIPSICSGLIKTQSHLIKNVFIVKPLNAPVFYSPPKNPILGTCFIRPFVKGNITNSVIIDKKPGTILQPFTEKEDFWDDNDENKSYNNLKEFQDRKKHAYVIITTLEQIYVFTVLYFMYDFINHLGSDSNWW